MIHSITVMIHSIIVMIHSIIVMIHSIIVMIHSIIVTLILRKGRLLLWLQMHRKSTFIPVRIVCVHACICTHKCMAEAYKGHSNRPGPSAPSFLQQASPGSKHQFRQESIGSLHALLFPTHLRVASLSLKQAHASSERVTSPNASLLSACIFTASYHRQVPASSERIITVKVWGKYWHLLTFTHTS